MTVPSGMDLRPLTRADIDAVYELGAAYDAVMVREPDIDKADLEAFWNTPSFDCERDTRGVFEGEGLLAMAIILKGQHFEICVHPDRHGCGFGSMLANWAEGQARAAGLAKGFQSSPRTDRAALAIFAERGYELAWISWVLELPADVTVPHRELATGYAVHPYRPGKDERAAHEVIQTAFGEWPDRARSPFEDWRALVLDRKGFIPEQLLVATHDAVVVGAAWVVDGESAGWVEALAVDKAHRNRGLAQALLATAFEGTRSRGLERAQLATDTRTGALGLYERLGMRVSRSYEDWSITLQS